MDQGVGREIKRLREERGWSQAKLAVEAEMSVSGVSMIENGQRNLTTTTLGKLAKAFGLEVGDLFPKAAVPLFAEPPEGIAGGEEQRREYPYDWMSDAFAALIDVWGEQVERRESPALSRSIWINCHMAVEAIIRGANLVDTWGSGQLSPDEWDGVRPEYLASREEWFEVQDRLYEIARKGLEHYEEASKEAEAAGEVRELWEVQERREAIRRRMRELSA